MMGIDYAYKPNLIVPTPAKYANIISKPVVGPEQRLNLSPLGKERQWKLTYTRITTAQRDAIKWHWDYHLGEYDTFWWKDIPAWADLPNLIPYDYKLFTGWIALDGSTITRTQGVADPAGGLSATRLQATVGNGAMTYKYILSLDAGITGATGYLDIWMRVRTGSAAVELYGADVSRTLTSAEGWQRVILSGEMLKDVIGIAFHAATVSSGFDIDVFIPKVWNDQLQVRWAGYAQSHELPERWKVDCTFMEISVTVSISDDVPAPVITYLEVESVDPADESADIAVDAAIGIVFNLAINSSTLAGEISVTANAEAIDFTASVDGAELTITPDSNLPSGADIIVTLGTGIESLTGLVLEAEFTWNFRTYSAVRMFISTDSLQPVEGVDFAPGLTIEHISEDEDTLEADHRLYGTHCWKEGGAKNYTRITGSSLSTLIKNILFNIYFPDSTGTFSLANFLNSSDESLCDVTWNGSTGVISVGSAVTAGSIITKDMYHTLQLIESAGNFTLKIDGNLISLTGTQTVPSAPAKLVLGVTTAEEFIFFDNFLSAD